MNGLIPLKGPSVRLEGLRVGFQESDRYQVGALAGAAGGGMAVRFGPFWPHKNPI